MLTDEVDEGFDTMGLGQVSSVNGVLNGRTDHPATCDCVRKGRHGCIWIENRKSFLSSIY